MKKNLLSAVVISSVIVLGISSAYAYRGANGTGPGDCWRSGGKAGAYVQMDEETQKKYDAFYAETKDLRRSIAAKRAEFHALMRGDNPDPAKAGQLKGELFDLQDTMRSKAKEAGVKAGFGHGCGIRDRIAYAGQGKGPGKGAGNRPCPAQGQGKNAVQ